MWISKVVNREQVRWEKETERWSKMEKGCAQKQKVHSEVFKGRKMWCAVEGSLEVLSAHSSSAWIFNDLRPRRSPQILPSPHPLHLHILLLLHPLHCDEKRKLPIFAQSQCICQELRSIKENIREEPPEPKSQSQECRI